MDCHLYMILTVNFVFFRLLKVLFQLTSRPSSLSVASRKKDLPAVPSKADQATVAAINYTDIPNSQIRKVTIFINFPV